MNKTYKNLIKFSVTTAVLVATASIGYEYAKYGSVFSTTSSNRAMYIKALEQQNNTKYRDAYYTFGQITPRYNAYDAVLFHQAQCAEKIADELTAIKKYKHITLKYSDSPLAAQAAYNLARAYLRVKDVEKAEIQFLNITKNYSDTDYAIGSYYYLGELNESNNKDKALAYWKKYIAVSPNGRFSLECIDKIISSHEHLSQEDKWHLGVALYNTQQHRKAIGYLEQLPIEKSWYYLAKSYQATRNRTLALKMLKIGIKNHSKDIAEYKLWDAMRSYVELNSRSRSRSWNDLANFAQKGKDFALYNRALIYTHKQAMPYYAKIADKHASGKFASEALWNVFWDQYNKKHYLKAIETGKKHMDSYPYTLAAPKILFWMGKTCEKLNHNNVASTYYDKVLDSYPDSYYAFRAIGRKSALRNGNDPGWVTNVGRPINTDKFHLTVPYSDDYIKTEFGKLTNELIKTKDLNLLLSIKNKDEFIDSWIKYNEGLKTKSIVIARNKMADVKFKPEKSDARWHYIYPLHFADKVNDYAKVNEIDPLIALSLMREESYFNPFAVSSSNARGLMQLLPGTAKDIARWRQLGSVTTMKLFDPETNIKLGTAYLGYVKGLFNGSTVYAVGSYNGGPGAVGRWIKDSETYDTDEFIENIPYDQTRDYIKKVYRSYWNYKRIYNFK